MNRKSSPGYSAVREGFDELTIGRLTTFDQIESIHGEWTVLHDEPAPGSIHSDFDRYCLTVKFSNDNESPVVFTFCRKKELVGLTAGYYHERTIPLKLGTSSIINNVQIYNNNLHEFHSQLTGEVHGDGIQQYCSPDVDASYDRYINGFKLFISAPLIR